MSDGDVHFPGATRCSLTRELMFQASRFMTISSCLDARWEIAAASCQCLGARFTSHFSAVDAHSHCAASRPEATSESPRGAAGKKVALPTRTSGPGRVVEQRAFNLNLGLLAMHAQAGNLRLNGAVRRSR